MHRHDPSRTGASDGAADLAQPAIQWRYYLGGSVSTNQLLAEDINRDGRVEVVFISGGRLVAKMPDDTVVWQTPPMTLEAIRGVEDLDGDGVLDVIVSGRPALVAIFRGTDGALQWRTDPQSIGVYIGAVRMADFNRDGQLDLYVADHACGSTGSRGDVAFAFDFSGGFAPGIDDGSQRLWQLERGG